MPGLVLSATIVRLLLFTASGMSSANSFSLAALFRQRQTADCPMPAGDSAATRMPHVKEERVLTGQLACCVQCVPDLAGHEP